MKEQSKSANPEEIWTESGIRELQAAMNNGNLTSSALVMSLLERIAHFDHAGPAINSVLEVNPDAWQQAEALDAERRNNGSRGPLHGIPVLLKDNINTADKMHTSAGSLALAESYAPHDAFVTRQLRRAGAVILGKANMTEWANFMADDMPSGYSSRGGQVQNPYGPGRFDVGGSSSGAAAAVASGFAVVAVGTETSGSILSPASQNSLVGIKPTVGLISRSGIIPIAWSQDTAGPMARTVTDAAILLGALAGVDADDVATLVAGGHVCTDYTSCLQADGLAGARIGVARQLYDDFPSDKLALLDAAIADLRRLGATVIDPVSVPSATAAENDYQVLVYEYKPALNAYLAQLAARVPVHSLAELIAYNAARPDEMLRYGQARLLAAEATSGRLCELEYVEARLRDLRTCRAEGIDAVLAEQQLDALLFPNNCGAGIAAKAGYPSITVPAGYTPDGEPVGATLTGPAWSEPTLLRLAYAYEQGTRHRVPPTW